MTSDYSRSCFLAILVEHDAIGIKRRDVSVFVAETLEHLGAVLSGETAEPADLRRGQCSFDYRAFLPLLPIFKRFNRGELDDFTRRTEVIEFNRGRILFQNASAAGHVVARRAVEILHAENDRRHRVGVLGPGRLCGTLAMIEGQPHSMSAAARERSVLLEIPRAEFDTLFAGWDPAVSKFQDAINRDLLQAARPHQHSAHAARQPGAHPRRPAGKEESGRATTRAGRSGRGARVETPGNKEEGGGAGEAGAS